MTTTQYTYDANELVFEVYSEIKKKVPTGWLWPKKIERLKQEIEKSEKKKILTNSNRGIKNDSLRKYVR